MSDKDPQLEFKKRARRRLVGAIALALLAAIILPIVMDQEPQPVNQDIQIRIPGRDTPFEGRAGFASAVEPEAAKAPPKPAPSDATAPPAVPAPEQAAAAAGAVAEKPVADAPATAPETAPAKPAEKESVAKAAGKDSAPRSDEQRAQAILDARDEYVVQLGVFSDPTNVRKVQARVKAEGYNSFTEAIGSGKTRVRAGPFAGRDAAERARDKLKRGGLDGMVAPKS